MRYPIFILMLLLPNNLFAQGDYEFSMTGGYRFVRCNSVDTCICRTDDSVVFSPMDYDRIGPIKSYAMASNHLILRTIGRENRPGTFERPVENETWYFAINKSNDAVEGPISQTDFDTDSRFPNKLDWKSSKHPYGYVYLVLILVAGLILIALPIGLIWYVSQRRKPIGG